MSYDMTFCSNDNCVRKHDCHRWLMYQVFKADKQEDKPRYIMMYNGDSDNCLMFLDDKEVNFPIKRKVIK